MWYTIETIFPELIYFPVSASITFPSMTEKSISKAISDKYGLRSNLLSCLSKLSRPNKLDCKTHDKGCCLLIKLSHQTKKVMKNRRKKSQNKVKSEFD